MPARPAEAGAPRYPVWLALSLPAALVIDVCVAGFGRFAWCGFGCATQAGDLGVAVVCLAIVAVVTFLAVALPPWIPGRRRPVIAAVAALMAVVLGALWVFTSG